MSGYYEKKINEAEEKMKIAVIAMKIGLQMVDFKYELFKKIAYMHLMKIQEVNNYKIEKNINNLDSLVKNNYLKKMTDKEIEDLVQNELRMRGIKDKKIEKQVKDKIKHMTSASNITGFAWEYKNALEEYHLYQSRLSEDLRAKAKRKQQEDNVKTSIDTPKEFIYGSSEEKKKKLMEKIENYINDSNQMGLLPSELKREIEGVYPDLKSSYGFYSKDILYKGISLANIEHKKKYFHTEIANAAVSTYEIVTKDLLFGSVTSSSSDIFRKIGISNSLEKYEQIYKKYMKVYNSLSQEEKNTVLYNIRTNSEYNKLFGEGIVTPEEMKNKINSYVRSYIINNKNDFFRTDDEYGKLSHALKYMTPEEVKTVYGGMLSESSKRYYSNYMSMNGEEQEKYELMFAKIALKKLEEKSNPDSTYNLTSEQQAEKDRKIAAVIVGLFKQTPKMSKYEQIAQKEDLTNLYQSLLDQYNAKKNTAPDIFGIERVMDAFKKLQKWALSLIMTDTAQDTNQDTNQNGFTKKY